MGKNTGETQGGAAERLRRSAESYLDNAVALGRVTGSRFYYDDYLNKFAGYTEVETTSGMGITKMSNGDYIVKADYAEADEDGAVIETTVTADLIATSTPVVNEHQLETSDTRARSTTLDRETGAFAIQLMARELDQIAKAERKVAFIPPKTSTKVELLQMPEGLADLSNKQQTQDIRQ